MNRISSRTFVVVCLLLVLGRPAHGGPVNPTPSDAYGNTAGGSNALLNTVVPGQMNTAFGYYALFSSSTGAGNTAAGANALFLNDTGNANTATGVSALNSNKTGSNNTAAGAYALCNNSSGSQNTADGFSALSSNTGGNFNTASGYVALGSNKTGNNNTAAGANALLFNTSGSENTASGVGALFNNTTGARNTALGRNALRNSATGNSNLALGYGAGSQLTSGGENIYLGHPGAARESKTLRLGKAQTRTFVAGVAAAAVAGNAVYVTKNGQLGIKASSARYKTDIAPLGERSDSLHQLRPVTFRYKEEPGGLPEYGLIAEEVAAVYPELVTRDARGVVVGVRYEALIPLLLNELQQQQRLLEAQALQISAQAERIDAVLGQLAELSAQNESLRAAVGQLWERGAEQRATRVAATASARPVAHDVPESP